MNYKEWQKERAKRKREAKIVDNICEVARAKRERESKQLIASRAERATKSRLMHIAVPSKLRIERVVTAQTAKSRETIQDYITKTDNVWLAGILRK